MRRIVIRGCIGGVSLLAILVVVLLIVAGGSSIPEALIAPGAIGLEVNRTNWRLTEASYEAPVSYDQLSSQLYQQMTARGWRSLFVSPNLGPSIFNPDPTPLMFQRSYWFGWMQETVRVKGTNGSPTQVEVVVTRSVRWPSVLRWLWFRLRGL